MGDTHQRLPGDMSGGCALLHTMSDENTDESKDNGIERNLGVQPVDALLMEHNISNQAIVAATKEPLTHKAVQRARKGRLLTPQTQRRVVVAVNAALKAANIELVCTLADLFTYKALDKGKTLPTKA